MRESGKAIAAYAIYRDMGPDRSLRACAEQYKMPLALLSKWSRSHDWQARVKEHDLAIVAELGDREKRRRIAEADERRKDRLIVAKAVRGKVVLAIKDLQHTDITNRPTLIVPMLEYADRTERLDHDEATERVGVEGEMSLSALVAIALRRESK